MFGSLSEVLIILPQCYWENDETGNPHPLNTESRIEDLSGNASIVGLSVVPGVRTFCANRYINALRNSCVEVSCWRERHLWLLKRTRKQHQGQQRDSKGHPRHPSLPSTN